jgi:hypothetical protein
VQAIRQLVTNGVQNLSLMNSVATNTETQTGTSGVADAAIFAVLIPANRMAQSSGLAAMRR